MAKDKKALLFDSKLRCKSGKSIPYYDEHWYEDRDNTLIDQSEHWFHEGYGYFRKYKLHRIDDTEYFVCEYLHQYKHKTEIDFEEN